MRAAGTFMSSTPFPRNNQPAQWRTDLMAWLPIIAGLAVLYVPSLADLFRGIWSKDEQFLSNTQQKGGFAYVSGNHVIQAEVMDAVLKGPFRDPQTAEAQHRFDIAQRNPDRYHVLVDILSGQSPEDVPFAIVVLRYRPSI